VPIP